MNRDLASGPLVWLGIIVTTCLLLVIFQTALWLVMPILLAVVAYYMLSPLVSIAMSKGLPVCISLPPVKSVVTCTPRKGCIRPAPSVPDRRESGSRSILQ